MRPEQNALALELRATNQQAQWLLGSGSSRRALTLLEDLLRHYDDAFEAADLLTARTLREQAAAESLRKHA